MLGLGRGAFLIHCCRELRLVLIRMSMDVEPNKIKQEIRRQRAAFLIPPSLVSVTLELTPESKQFYKDCAHIWLRNKRITPKDLIIQRLCFAVAAKSEQPTSPASSLPYVSCCLLNILPAAPSSAIPDPMLFNLPIGALELWSSHPGQLIEALQPPLLPPIQLHSSLIPPLYISPASSSLCPCIIFLNRPPLMLHDHARGEKKKKIFPPRCLLALRF